MNSLLDRFGWVLPAVLALALGGACSDDDSGDDGAAGSAGSSSGETGSGGNGGSAGTMMSSAGSDGGEAMYSAAEACERFAEVTCSKGEECGLVVTSPVRACLECNALVLNLIATQCAMELGGPRNAADVDRCLDSIADNTCDETCSDAPFEGCEAFDELPSGDGAGVECNIEQCL